MTVEHTLVTLEVHRGKPFDRDENLRAFLLPSIESLVADLRRLCDDHDFDWSLVLDTADQLYELDTEQEVA